MDLNIIQNLIDRHISYIFCIYAKDDLCYTCFNTNQQLPMHNSELYYIETNPPKKQAVCSSLELIRQISTSPSNRSWTLKPTTTSTAAEDCTSYPMTYDLKTRRRVFT